MRNDKQLGFKNRAKLIMPHIIQGIDQSFSKHLAKMNGNRLRTCNDYEKDMKNSMKKFLEEFETSQNEETLSHEGIGVCYKTSGIWRFWMILNFQ